MTFKFQNGSYSDFLSSSVMVSRTWSNFCSLSNSLSIWMISIWSCKFVCWTCGLYDETNPTPITKRLAPRTQSLLAIHWQGNFRSETWFLDPIRMVSHHAICCHQRLKIAKESNDRCQPNTPKTILVRKRNVVHFHQDHARNHQNNDQ